MYSTSSYSSCLPPVSADTTHQPPATRSLGLSHHPPASPPATNHTSHQARATSSPILHQPPATHQPAANSSQPSHQTSWRRVAGVAGCKSGGWSGWKAGGWSGWFSWSRVAGRREPRTAEAQKQETRRTANRTEQNRAETLLLRTETKEWNRVLPDVCGMCMCMYCVYICICVYIYIHTYIHTYIYM